MMPSRISNPVRPTRNGSCAALDKLRGAVAGRLGAELPAA
jgi:hypothetical protein